MTEKAKQPSAKPDKSKKTSEARADANGFTARSVARLHAVQAVYGQLINPEAVPLVVNDYLTRRAGMEVEGEKLASPDRALFSKIVQGVEERRSDLDEMIRGSLNEGARTPEALLVAILLCGIYELLAENDTDVPVIVTEYVDIAHAYYPPGETKLINAVLDRLGKTLRV
ncbi:MAG: transcription antitermination factor NusB [Alphaproteobacteria bacterium]|nr:transcription antitermination factor NusB [Alphaproteobacteria bacterium]MCD8571285.1 transcription antitermination factor NusB [Alphaproteobacteria bacterium]